MAPNGTINGTVNGNGKPRSRFELPVLTPINYSLTDGTDIPPPPESPIEEAAPPPEPVPKDETAAPAVKINGFHNGEGRPSVVDKRPLSPALTTRPSSIRRFLSRKSLNANYMNGTNDNISPEELSAIGRPDSPSSFLSGKPGLSRKKSGSWFRRLASSSNRNHRTSVVYENGPPQKTVPRGPPPPKLPELNQLKAKVEDDDKGSLGGDDMFKNIT